MKNFRTLDLAIEFYHLACGLRLNQHLTDQLQRAALSISLNLAEGRGRATLPDQKRFFNIALGSLRECQAILKISKLESSAAGTSLDRLGAKLFCLIKNAR